MKNLSSSALCVLILASAACLFAQAPAKEGKKLSAPELIAQASANDPKLPSSITASFDEKELKAGTAVLSQGPDFFFALESATEPKLLIDDAPAPAMHSTSGSLWYATARIQPVGTLHAFHYRVANADFGGRLDLPAYPPNFYAQPGVPQGKLSARIAHTSKIYEGMHADYWIYVPAQYSPQTPAALMVFQDGEGYAKRPPTKPDEPSADHGILNVIDNLIAQKKIPVMICVFINPGELPEPTPGSPGSETYKLVQAHATHFKRTLKDSMRSTLYDTVSDRYPRYLRDEILASVAAQYPLRPDAYSRAITGLSSGGICAFNAAWQMPDQFSRVITWIGSFTSIQWQERPDVSDGGQDYPDKILREPHRNIRVWLQDGSNDQENPNYGSWPLANIRMANALKSHEYDFHFSFGKGTHNAGHGAAQFDKEMEWLWRNYDPTKTEETYSIDPTEKSQPHYRVTITNRSAE